VKRAIRDRFGVDVGVDPGLDTLSTMAGQQMLGEAQQLKGSFSDRDVKLIQSLTASPSRGREANIAILKARQEVLARLDREAELEEQYFERSQSRAGFEAWLQSQDLGPVFSQEAVESITKPIQEAERGFGQRLTTLADAVAKGSSKAVDEVIGKMSDDELRRLPAELRDRALRILEGG
jgi:hypothetical protein